MSAALRLAVAALVATALTGVLGPWMAVFFGAVVAGVAAFVWHRHFVPVMPDDLPIHLPPAEPAEQSDVA